jgi:transposase
MEANNLKIPTGKATKADLLKIIADSEVNKEKKYYVDTIAQQNGHVVLRLPPYYCVLNPIELVWSQFKAWRKKIKFHSGIRVQRYRINKTQNCKN